MAPKLALSMLALCSALPCQVCMASAAGLGAGGDVFTVRAALVSEVRHVLLHGRPVEQCVGQVAVRGHVHAVIGGGRRERGRKRQWSQTRRRSVVIDQRQEGDLFAVGAGVGRAHGQAWLGERSRDRQAPPRRRAQRARKRRGQRQPTRREFVILPLRVRTSRIGRTPLLNVGGVVPTVAVRRRGTGGGGRGSVRVRDHGRPAPSHASQPYVR